MKTRFVLSCSVAAVIGVLGAAPVQGEALLQQTDVFVSGSDGYFGYRIPAIETAPDGTLLALAEARKHNLGDPGYEGNDIDLVCRRSTDAGVTWSPMKTTKIRRRWSAANPATLMTKQVWLFYLQAGRNT